MYKWRIVNRIRPNSVVGLLVALGTSWSGLLIAQYRSPDLADGSRLPARGERNAWRMWGGNLQNTHSSFLERRLGPDNVGALSLKWTFVTEGELSATPTVE